MMMTNLNEDVCRAIVSQARRFEKLYERPDASAFETYGRVLAAQEQVEATMTPMKRIMKEYWNEVARNDADTQAAMLGQMQTQAEDALQKTIIFAALVCRGIWSASPYVEKKVGQMSIEDLEDEKLPEVDKSTGEVIGDGQSEPG